MAEPVDYAALAKQAGATASQPAGAVDYTALAKQAGATGSTPAEKPAAPAKPLSLTDQLTDVPKGIWNSLVQGGQGIVDTGKAVFNSAAHLVGARENEPGLGHTAENIGAAQDAVRLKAIDAAKRGDYVEASRHALHYILPMVGPGIDASGDKAQAGRWGEAAGEAIGTGLQLAGPKLLEGVKVPITPRITNPNTTEAAATSFLEDKGVPVSAAAKTGNTYVKNIQKAADSTPIGGVVAHRAQAATTKALQGTADELASQAHPAAVAPEQAGEGVRTALSTKATDLGKDADTAYGEFKRIENLPQNTRTVQTGTKPTSAQPSALMGANGQPLPGQPAGTAPVTQTMQLPVDLAAIKRGLTPIYQDMQKWMEPAARNSSQGFQAIKSLLEGPDQIPASQAEVGLGGLKQLARDGSGRNAGIAKLMTSRLQTVIDQTVKGAGRDAIDALKAGRAATADQYGVQGIVDQLRQEPVQTFRQMTYAKDSGVDLLRQVSQHAPAELPKVGRAFLDSLFDKAQDTGGFGHADKLFSDWSNLGPETKRMLYPDAILRGNLDKFFLGAKKLAENPNPSGSGVIGISGGTGALIVTHPATGIPLAIGAGALSKMMHSTTGVRLLTEGMKLPANKLAAVATAGQILKMAGDDVQPLSKAADAPQEQNEPLAKLQAGR